VPAREHCFPVGFAPETAILEERRLRERLLSNSHAATAHHIERASRLRVTRTMNEASRGD
jgi:hypothetical protein